MIHSFSTRSPHKSCWWGEPEMQARGLRAHPTKKADGWIVGLHSAAPGQRQGLRHHDAVQCILIRHSDPAPDQRLHTADSPGALFVSARLEALSMNQQR